MNSKPQRSLRARIRKWLHLEDVPSPVRRTIVGIIGGTILLIGLAMTVLPGPAIVVIPVGLAVLATEFVWARRWLRKVRKLLHKARETVIHTAKKNDSPDDRR
ncbi:MAG TPA: PGPGW domain-containing protein [Verrucomicrobiae bacterium]|nr:PGPGW domain-containing protein [Verrucomicrobiae bacterium]